MGICSQINPLYMHLLIYNYRKTTRATDYCMYCTDDVLTTDMAQIQFSINKT